jgi:hypothetical protein
MASGKSLKSYLDQIIADMDAGKKPRRPSTPKWVRDLAVPAAVGLSLGLGLAGCAGEDGAGEITRGEVASAKADGMTDRLCVEVGAEPGCDLCEELDYYDDGICDEFCDYVDPDCAIALYMAVLPEDGDLCHDGEDNDFDGQVDCDDTDCSLECAVVAYMAPWPEEGICDDGVDNDADGKIDCDDPDCATSLECAVVAYMAPWPEEDICDDGADNDADGLVDCDDPDCADECAAETEACFDDVDNDGDGLVDCSDPDCSLECSVVAYGVPWPLDEVCDDGVDNDGDGRTDCDDSDCVCATPRYMAPQ